ncbi:MAG: hypothetical protein TREMPRED_004788 [Tremellales sp. Tagirdzhanova-0007]|nr:MAG: hypothetical protein TREMPRED_004788 [Tremellales sp. Tagirdzhanova-0007]
MPLEMTPAPFPNDRLPYTPLHIPGDVAGVNAPRGASTVAPGPASTAASAIIPPTPGGVAGPHNAIPALPDAGYTAPSLRPAPLAQGSRASSVAAYGQHLGANGARPIQAAYPGVPVSGYGGGSMYGGASMYNPPGATIAALQNTNSLPSPRRSHPPQALDPNMEQPPPLYAGTAPSEVYDDGASIAESAMTFMDGPVQGRTSQYGLPKYPHTPKMDYRRFCVQRGNADVYLD